MRSRPLLWQLYLWFLPVLVISLAAVGWYASHSLHTFYLGVLDDDLCARGQMLASRLSRADLEQTEALNALCKRLDAETGSRITVVLPSGVVAADSAADATTMENHANRPEIAEALAGVPARSVRFSDTTQRKRMYVAVPIRDGSAVIGVVRLSLPLTRIDQVVFRLYMRIAAAGVITALLAALVCYLASRHLTAPLHHMERVVDGFARGDLTRRIPAIGSAEVVRLADAMNRMAAQLDEHIRTVVQQRNEQRAVFASMTEGVIALDPAQRLIHLNAAARRLLQAVPDKVRGRTIQEVVRNPDLNQFVARTFAAPDRVEGDIVLRAGEDVFLQAHGSVLRDETGVAIGALIVLNDVTRLRKLENVRREFVANVSHELKTPITSIRGFAETLLDGALDQPQEARRFVGIIAEQSLRLESIINDILELSRVEHDAERFQVPLESGDVVPVLQAAVRAAAPLASGRRIAVRLAGAEHAAARIAPALLERAVVNLLDNAIKFSEPGKSVEVVCEDSPAGILIHVKDQGCGIAKEHLPRLFERFYRVDKGRSRKLGGTGLGLAIVKHIALAHGGSVSVESEPGLGSTFTIRLPRAG